MLQDNEEQFATVEEVIKANDVHTTVEVIAEVVYVLSSVYRVPRNEVSWMIHCILLDVRVENLKTLRYALGLFDQTSLDFVDCILVAYHKVLGVDIMSFDKKLNSALEKAFPIYQQEIPPEIFSN
ncbi:MAG: PIN domain-containing protein [Spirochaetales bacterium]|nr:PIN domain-containing protein [Spirochaetales bacterium]